MNSQTSPMPAPLVIPSIWSKVPLILTVGGGLLALIGLATDSKQLGYSYLVAFMFFLSLCLGGLFLTLLHHLFDASWSTPIRRVTEHLGFLLPVMFFLFIPIALLSGVIYPWMSPDAAGDHALHAKYPLFTRTGWLLVSLLVFAVWGGLTYRLRYWSLQQDKTGAAHCTVSLRRHASWGIFAFALTLTSAAIFWMKGLEYHWFSTMYGVYYFAGSVWTTLATVYLIVMVLKHAGPLSQVIQRRQMHDLGVLFFAFTVFYAYIHFSQYFLIWNAAIPEETYYYVKREQGSWWDIGLLIVFGHFLIPFLALLRIDAKVSMAVIIPLTVWAWFMHYCDMSFNIMPVLHTTGFRVHWLDFACMAFIGGVLSTVWLKYFHAHPPYPIRDPRLGEALGIHHYEAAPGAKPAGK